MSDDEVLFLMVDDLPLLTCPEVDAVCVDIQLQHYRFWRQEKLMFSFRVFEPHASRGVILHMYVRFKQSWRKPPTASKLNKLLRTAALHLKPGRRVSLGMLRKLFVNQAFRCALKTTDAGKASYSVVDRVLKRLTGSHF